MKILKGIAASDGFAKANAFIYDNAEIKVIKKTNLSSAEEITLYNNAVKKSSSEINELVLLAEKKLGPEKAEIFRAHLQILLDPEFDKQVKHIVNSEKVSAAYSVEYVANEFVKKFLAIPDDYFKERAADVKDVSMRVIRHILNIPVIDLSLIKKNVIIVANDLTPSETAQLDPKNVKGFICNVGGRTAHAAIMARSLKIPAVLGTNSATTDIKNGDILILDGTSGEVIINPNKEVVDGYQAKLVTYENEIKALEVFKTKKSETKDNVSVGVEANIGSPADMKSVVECNADGVGLFRTEFLYMENTNFPTEEQQFEAYKAVLAATPEKQIIIRTLDIGGDKELSYYKFPKELNPFLGVRAIRFCLNNPDIFKTQLRALWKASIFGKLGIMFPMIATVEEFVKAKQIALECKKELIAEGIKVANNVEIGMMIEIPAAALNAKGFAKYSDFFSIGTNDLIQYSMAADRGNDHLSYLYQPCNPAILKLIKFTIDAAHENKRWVGMCGEMAADKHAIPLLVGLGLDYFSMSASSVLKARKLISETNSIQAKELVKKALQLDTANDIVQLVDKFIA